jgi:hypothetical protein
VEALPGCSLRRSQSFDKYCGVKMLASGRARRKPASLSSRVRDWSNRPAHLTDATPQKSFGFEGSHYPRPIVPRTSLNKHFDLQASLSALTAEQVSERGRLSTFSRFGMERVT